MVYNTLTVATAVTPTVIETYFSHYLKRKSLHEKPTAHISYHEGLSLVRRFLYYASFHTVEELQNFTAQWVPHPRWVKVDEVTLPEDAIIKAAHAVEAQFGHRGIDKVGGRRWWQWRREGSVLQAEWIEMRGDYMIRKQSGDKGKRVMLYVHGGAYFFGSVDEHRYQMQRHARKLKAKVFARESCSRYRLAPQFPFPCGLHDCLAAYMYLLTVQDPSNIILAGDSAGGGMVLSMLVIMRDRGIPLPAGAILISPWVDLTHSFPSVAGDNSLDYIPAHGFMHRPSASWPPPNSDDMEQIAMHAVEAVVGEDLPRKSTQQQRREATQNAIQGFTVEHVTEKLHPEHNDANPAGTEGAGTRPGNTIPGAGHDLSIMLDGKMVTLKDQIQMYATNQLISHPLVSPALQPSLGGLPPLLIMTGGGEVLRDEQIYIAHKAADPSKYPPGEMYLDEYPEARDTIAKWKPTDVQLQVWDDLCHVAPTLSFTRPAKYMYRSIAQFGAWALARAQKTGIEIQDDDDVSIISEGSENDTDSSSDPKKPRQYQTTMHDGVAQGQAVSTEKVGKSGDKLPPFQSHMIRQRVDRHGNIYPLGPASLLPGLQMSPNEIGVIKPGPVRKWLEAKTQWDNKFASEKRKVQKQRVIEMARGFEEFGDDEVPPPSSLARRRGKDMPKEAKKTKSMGLSLWSSWGSSHDEKTIGREEKADKDVDITTVTPEHGANAGHVNSNKAHRPLKSRSRSRSRIVTDEGQTTSSNNSVDENTTAAELLQKREQQTSHTGATEDGNFLSPSFVPARSRDSSSKAPIDSTGDTTRPSRPTAVGVTLPFKLGRNLDTRSANASTITLTSHAGVVTPKDEDQGSKLDREANNGLEGAREAVGPETVVANGRVMDASETRPGVERFETAHEIL